MRVAIGRPRTAATLPRPPLQYEMICEEDPENAAID
jgi:hypothetical protein